MSPHFAITSALVVSALGSVGDDAVDVVVEISPIDTECLESCPVIEQPPALPVTGGEPLSIALPLALFLAGIATVLWVRRPSVRP